MHPPDNTIIAHIIVFVNKTAQMFLYLLVTPPRRLQHRGGVGLALFIHVFIICVCQFLKHLVNEDSSIALLPLSAFSGKVSLRWKIFCNEISGKMS